MEKFLFDPADGFLDAGAFPNPTSEQETREQFQRLHNQLAEYVRKISTTYGTEVVMLRLNPDLGLEYSVDGQTWNATASSGHIVLNEYGDQFPQRMRLMFKDCVVEDDPATGVTIVSGIKGDTGPAGPQGVQGPAGAQGIQGLQGPAGPQGEEGPAGPQGPAGLDGADGRTFVVRGRFNSLSELTTVYPAGQEGWAYAVGTAGDNVIYIWDVETAQWSSLGRLQGPAGAQGPQGDTGPQGPQGVQGPAGPQGEPGEPGNTGPAGVGVPTGGKTGQVLVKSSDTSYETKWEDYDRRKVAYNLLDNSDFRNPVNQRGNISYDGPGYNIDRWNKDSNGVITVNDGYITHVASDNGFYQILPVEKLKQISGKVCTIAVMAKANSSGSKLRIGVGSGGGYLDFNLTSDWSYLIRTYTYDFENYPSRNNVVLRSVGNVSIKYVALYEGEYTAETLPEYMPKGYAHELMECKRYFRPIYGFNRPSYTGPNAPVFFPVDLTDMRDNLSVSIGTVTKLYVCNDGSSIMCTFSNASAYKGGISLNQSGFSCQKTMVVNLYWSESEYLAVSADL